MSFKCDIKSTFDGSVDPVLCETFENLKQAMDFSRGLMDTGEWKFVFFSKTSLAFTFSIYKDCVDSLTKQSETKYFAVTIPEKLSYQFSSSANGLFNKSKEKSQEAWELFNKAFIVAFGMKI